MAKAKKNRVFDILGEQISPGQRKMVELESAKLYTHSPLSIPIEVINGKFAGPTMMVNAAIHGDELNGVEVIRRLLRRKILRSIRGTLIAVPIVNVHGFLDQSRYLPDRRDLNRSFPGSPKGSIAARLAHLFTTQIVANADYGIDLHTGAINRSNFPQIRANLDDPATLDIARAFGAPVIINSNIRDGSLRGYAAERNLPILIYEAGEALRFDEVAIRGGIRGVLNVMRHIGMLPKNKRPKSATPVMAQSTSWVRAPTSGIVGGHAALGSSVEGGQSLATISDPLGDELTEVFAPFDGIVIGRSNLPLVHEGDALINLAAFKNVAAAERRVETFSVQHEINSESGT